MLRTSPRGFTLLELMVTVTITGIVTTLAVRALILTSRGRQLRESTAVAQSSGRTGLAFLQDDLRVASLGASTGVIWTTRAGEPRRPAIQIFDSVGGGGFLNPPAKPGTDALLIVRAAPVGTTLAPSGSTVLAEDLYTTTGAFTVTDATGFVADDRVLVGEYDDAVFMPLRAVDTGARQLTSGLVQNVFPGQHITKIPAGSLVRRARARLYYVDVKDRLMQAELLVPCGPEAAEVVGVRDVAQGVENLQITCTLETPGPCPLPKGSGDPLTSEAANALGPMDLGGARLDANNVPSVRAITIRVSVRSKALHDQSEPGDPPILLDGVSVPTPEGVHYARRAYEIGVAVRNTSLGAL
jgi:prepilin-type N-terminal cleavage/methylation domain-containing protein